MKAKDIVEGHLYIAKVNGRIVTVRVNQIYTRYDGRTRYGVTNLSTGRRTTFASAQKFRRAVSK